MKLCCFCRRQRYAWATCGTQRALSRYQEWAQPYLVPAPPTCNEQVATVFGVSMPLLNSFVPGLANQLPRVGRLDFNTKSCLQFCHCACLQSEQDNTQGNTPSSHGVSVSTRLQARRRSTASRPSFTSLVRVEVDADKSLRRYRSVGGGKRDHGATMLATLSAEVQELFRAMLLSCVGTLSNVTKAMQQDCMGRRVGRLAGFQSRAAGNLSGGAFSLLDYRRS